MSNYSSDRNDLHSRIAVFIPNGPRPNAIVLSTIDDEGTSRFFADREPASISTEESHLYAASMWFFTVDAFVYYMYPFLRAIVTSNAHDSVVGGHFLAQFTCYGDRERVKRADRIIELLTAVQIDVLLDVVKLLALVYPDFSTLALTRRLQQRKEVTCEVPKSDGSRTGQ